MSDIKSRATLGEGWLGYIPVSKEFADAPWDWLDEYVRSDANMMRREFELWDHVRIEILSISPCPEPSDQRVPASYEGMDMSLFNWFLVLGRVSAVNVDWEKLR